MLRYIFASTDELVRLNPNADFNEAKLIVQAERSATAKAAFVAAWTTLPLPSPIPGCFAWGVAIAACLRGLATADKPAHTDRCVVITAVKRKTRQPIPTS